MPRLTTLACAALILGLGLAGPASASRGPGETPQVPPTGALEPRLRLAQYYAPPPPPPSYRPRHHHHRRCWTETRRVVTRDRWGRAHVRYVPQRVCAYRR